MKALKNTTNQKSDRHLVPSRMSVKTVKFTWDNYCIQLYVPILVCPNSTIITWLHMQLYLYICLWFCLGISWRLTEISTVLLSFHSSRSFTDTTLTSRNSLLRSDLSWLRNWRYSHSRQGPLISRYLLWSEANQFFSWNILNKIWHQGYRKLKTKTSASSFEQTVNHINLQFSQDT